MTTTTTTTLEIGVRSNGTLYRLTLDGLKEIWSVV